MNISRDEFSPTETINKNRSGHEQLTVTASKTNSICKNNNEH